MFSHIESLDQTIFWLINSHHAVPADRFFLVITNFGSGWVVAPVILIFILKCIPSRERLWCIVFSLIVMIASGLVNSQVKHALKTPRPSALFAWEGAGGGPQRASVKTVHVVGERLRENSFPSGHTNTAVSAAMLMVLCFGRRFWPAFIVAGLVGYSRVYIGAHFPSDVTGGALLGAGVVWIGFVCYNKLYRKRKTAHDQQ
jgi:undecaprenyl-diphosphatase